MVRGNGRGKPGGARAYSDVDGLHALGAVEAYVPVYRAVSAVRGHVRVRLLLAQRDSDGAVSAHKNARGRPPAQACSGREDAFGGRRDDGIGRNSRRGRVGGGFERHLVHEWGLQRGVVEEDRHGGGKGGGRRLGHPGGL